MPSATSVEPPSPGPLLLGVDAGGTKTRAVLATAGSDECFCVLGVAEGGPGNPLSSGFDEAIRAIVGAVAEARQAVAGEATPRVAVLSIAGAAKTEVRATLEASEALRALADEVQIVADYDPVLACLDESKPNIGVIAGTGSVVVARSAGGETVVNGGWGFLLGDEGSGYALGRRAIRFALAENEARTPASVLTAELCRNAGASDAHALIQSVYSVSDPRSFIASLARTVLVMAQRDPSAHQLVTDECDALAGLIERAAAAAQFQERGYEIALAGGVLTGCTVARQALLSELTARGIGPAGVRIVASPVDGCLRLALRQAHSQGDRER